MTLKEYIKQRDNAVLSNDLTTFKKFLERAHNAHMIDLKDFIAFMTAKEVVQLATMHKMALNITTMPETRKQQAREWLKAHNMHYRLY